MKKVLSLVYKHDPELVPFTSYPHNLSPKNPSQCHSLISFSVYQVDFLQEVFPPKLCIKWYITIQKVQELTWNGLLVVFPPHKFVWLPWWHCLWG